MSRLETLPDGIIEKLRRKSFVNGEIIASRFRLKSLLGTGAMGQVFVAENLATNFEVAVKLLKADLIASSEFRQRFQKEAEAVGSISHQNVARFFDLVVGDPTFLVMEYVPGPTLQQMIEQERLPYERAVRIAVRLCWGLEAAHQRGIVHRDLKPANIIVATDPEVGDQPKIIDFGLAKLATATETAQLTRTGQIVGTPEYMAPEQIEGKTIDARADVYALGCVLYKMIAGKTPFGGDDDVQILYRQLHQKPTPLSEHVPEVPPKLDEVLARALAKKPADRFENTGELARALSRTFDRRRTSRISAESIAEQKKPPIALVAATTLAVGAVAGVLLGRLPSHGDGKPSQPAAVAGSATPAAGNELLVIDTTPEGATVELDGKALTEVTPTAVRGLAPGPHTVKLTAKGRSAVERKLTIERDARASLVVNLPPSQRGVLVRSVPGGAAVYLDNDPVGIAPVTVTVDEEDFHELRLEKLGFAPLIRAIKPGDEEAELALTMELDAQPHSELQVDSSADAEIWIDGVDTMLETPAMGIRLAPGRHTIQLRDSTGAASKVTTIDVKPGETLRMTINL
ncbi:MAG TPA: serine/threonine-protein kinase [Kofleriaceae bacterium]|nr:serine/threonine-protein kinase [Kofleriaceae bacterium]